MKQLEDENWHVKKVHAGEHLKAWMIDDAIKKVAAPS
ncbi:MAG: hypothetical protein ACI83P_002348 [Janthinobacterium sp.]|jgi:hypothetical protein